MIRTALVDDEPLALENLELLLASETDIDVVATYRGGKAALAGLPLDPPDLLFLDVQMPEINGFDVLAALDPSSLPTVIFVTAYDRYALQAFDAHALDYVLKPVDEDRFRLALDRARNCIQQSQNKDLGTQVQALLHHLQPQPEPSPTYLRRLALKHQGRIVFVNLDEVDWIEAAGNYVALHVGARTHLHRSTLSAFEAQLDPHQFQRIHRSSIVNLRQIYEMHPLHHGEYELHLYNGAHLRLARKYRHKLTQLLQQRR